LPPFCFCFLPLVLPACWLCSFIHFSFGTLPTRLSVSLSGLVQLLTILHVVYEWDISHGITVI
ncbi:hypothetical protein BJY52DRAFT_1299546, partial [Lactarius psammicola]